MAWSQISVQWKCLECIYMHRSLFWLLGGIGMQDGIVTPFCLFSFRRYVKKLNIIEVITYKKCPQYAVSWVALSSKAGHKRLR